jgi:hypothetical protein
MRWPLGQGRRRPQIFGIAENLLCAICAGRKWLVAISFKELERKARLVFQLCRKTYVRPNSEL